MRNPDEQSGDWKAWLYGGGDGSNPDHGAALATWLLHCPGAHPMWTYWCISCVHLRDLPGQSKPAYKRFPMATHEIMCFAIDPRGNDDNLYSPDPDNPPWRMMTPVDWTHQIEMNGDDVAEKICHLIIQKIMTGASPDSDYARFWEDAINNTVAHYKSGAHATA